MSVLVSSRNIFLSTTPSGNSASGGIEDGIDTFRAIMNSVPLQTQNGEYAKISLVDFTMYRNFYYVNAKNNHVFFRLTETDGTVTDGDFILEKGDFILPDVQANFSKRLADALNAVTGISNVTVTNNVTKLPAYPNQTGNRKMNFKLTFADNTIASLILQCRNYNNNGVDNDGTTTSDFFNDSYALLGARRTSFNDTDFTSQNGFNVSISGDGEDVTVRSIYPMQTGTMPDIYLRCQEVVDNLESETFKINGTGGDSANIVSSTILGVIPVPPMGDITNDMVRYRGDDSSQYFIMSDNKNISELFFRITDAHGRSIVPLGNPLSPDNGNFFCQLTINFSVFTKGVGLPKNDNIENSNLRNAMIQQGIR